MRRENSLSIGDPKDSSQRGVRGGIIGFVNGRGSSNWFKSLFLGLLGGLALAKAIDEFGRNVLELHRFYVTNAIDFLTLFSRAWPLHMFVLFYFIVNTIRYYLATFVFDSFSHHLVTNPVTLGNNVSAALSRAERERFLEGIKTGIATQTWHTRVMLLNVVDLTFSCLIIFMIGLVGLSVAHFVSFAALSIAVIAVDISQIIYQRSCFIPLGSKTLSKLRK